MSEFTPVYLETYRSGELADRSRSALERLRHCTLCPRRCRVDRLADQRGVCRTGKHARVASAQPHFGEEAPLVGRHGSGTIFFTHCNLLCNFCQNYDISHEGAGRDVSATQLAAKMLALQRQGCHNVNFVTPSHVVPQILAALEYAIEGGLCVPLVYNSSTYDDVETLKLLDGVIDIYMPDFKFWDSRVADLTCRAPDYPELARKAVREMYRQVGDLVLDSAGIAQRGLLVRHLVMPYGMAGTRDIMRFLAQEVSAETYVNIMTQYRPCGQAYDIPELAVRPTDKEFQAAMQAAQEEGITRLDRPRHFFRMF
ncbi:radical SAM protein [candidate division KSB3 bacterium]|uniref:Radical SAM protein n=1 Tax=candidate division KSB3 bacterium TaxID=2044937 RepID=A0A9D5JUT3_9BACT|nr:radical SAM protein [candidate division KSB3 bacterium]MBD3324307.1 radical SAM protein [candidate division KSB3 bacterium]